MTKEQKEKEEEFERRLAKARTDEERLAIETERNNWRAQVAQGMIENGTPAAQAAGHAAQTKIEEMAAKLEEQKKALLEAKKAELQRNQGVSKEEVEARLEGAKELIGKQYNIDGLSAEGIQKLLEKAKKAAEAAKAQATEKQAKENTSTPQVPEIEKKDFKKLETAIADSGISKIIKAEATTISQANPVEPPSVPSKGPAASNSVEMG